MYKLLPISLVLLLTSCISASYPTAKIDSKGRATNPEATQYERQKVIGIRNALLNMDPNVTYRDADAISNMAVYYPQVLANRYKLVTPPLLHNAMVNTGFRSRGLCRNWAEDLIKRSRELNPESLDIYWGVSSRGKMHEHSSLVITAKGKSFSTGYILDPWRNSGNLYWIKVIKDPKYDWEDFDAK
ncbi:MAG: hypothetical protein K8R67_00785 [Desulfobacteraceae bacterium]|nr:hypothetical protein [Desulfobacteraceae bacterium]